MKNDFFLICALHFGKGFELNEKIAWIKTRLPQINES